MTIELFYSDGGHSGPFADEPSATERALRYLRGRPGCKWVQARPSTTATDAEKIGEIRRTPSGIFGSWGALTIGGRR